MTRVVTSARVDDELLAEVLAARTGAMPERRAPDDDGPAAGQGEEQTLVFDATGGPFRLYRRTVVVGDRSDAGTLVTQTVDFELAIPIFGWLFVLPFRLMIGKLAPPAKAPWWAPPDPLDSRAASMLASLCALTAIAVYPGFLLTQTIPFAREEMGFSHRAESFAFASVRADFVVALLLVGLADRHGRRRLTLAAISAGCVLSALSGLSPNLWFLAGTQMISRGCLNGAGILISIMAAEEMPAGSRAYAVSLITMSGALGAFTALVLFPLADLDPRAWRGLYVLALLGILLVRRFAPVLPESKRFTAPHVESKLSGHGRRFWLLGISALLFAIFLAPASQLQNEFLRSERHFSATRISIFTVATNIWGGIGIIVGGHLADVRGRRIVGSVGVIGGVGATVLMFLATGWSVWAWSTVGAVVGAITVPALGVYGPELFPTSLRGRANGIITGLGRVGSIIGLVVVGLLVDRLGSIGRALTIAAIGPAVLVILILAFYPETAHMELEDLNPEDRPQLPSVADGPV